MTGLSGCGVILAGGKSSRMGTAKELLDWQGEPLLLHLVHRVLANKLPCLVISNNPEQLPLEALRRLQIQVTSDISPSHGPISGIHTALTLRNEDVFLFLSCDLPFVQADDIAQLLTHVDQLETFDVIVPRTNDRIHPLLALYHRRTKCIWEEALQTNNLKVMKVLDQLLVHYLPSGELSEWSTFNMNTPEQYQIACEKGREIDAFSKRDSNSRRGNPKNTGSS